MKNFRFKTILQLFTEMSERHNVQGNSIRMKVTYSHLTKHILEMQSMGILEMKKIGRENRFKFTEKGKKLVILFKEINAILDEREGKKCCGERKNGK